MLPVRSSPSSVAEAWRWLQGELKGEPVPPLLVVIGLGDGYLLEALDQHAPNTRVLVLEPDSESSARFAARRDWDSWRNSGRLVYLADPDYVGADEAWRLFPPTGGKPRILTHLSLTRGENVSRAAQVLKRILFGVQANSRARKQFAPRYLTNSIRNVPAILGGTDLRALEDAYPGKPAVIVAAGPSLDESITKLRHLADRALLIAADTALRPLLAAGIAPSLVVGMDPGAANLRHFLALPECRNTWLVSESALDPHAAALFEDRTFWFRIGHHHPWPWLNEIGIDVAKIDVWGSVLTGAFQVACLSGCDPIIIVGADLAYTSERPYARGTSYEFEWAWSASLGMELPIAWGVQMSALKTESITDLRASQTPTTEVLLSYRDWILSRARRSGRRIVNASGAGILFGEGVEQLALEEALRDRSEIQAVSDFACPASGIWLSAVASRLRRVQEEVARGQRGGAPVPQWSEFSGEGFSPAAVGDALLDAAEILDERRERGPHISPWSDLVSRAVGGPLLTKLPEAMTRFGSGLNNIVPLPLDPSCDDAQERAAVLVEALSLLAGICGLLMQDQTVHPPDRYSSFPDPPVTALYAWNDQQRWAIETFEALLGKAWTPHVYGTAKGFLLRPVRVRNGQTSPAVDKSPLPVRICQKLVAEWLRCVRGLHGSTTADLALQTDLDRLQIIEDFLYRPESIDRSMRGTAALVLGTNECSTVTVPLGVSEEALARVLTGTLRRSRDAPCVLAYGRTGDSEAWLGIATQSTVATTPEPVVNLMSIAPRALTDEGVPDATIAYTTDRGAVCVRPHRPLSILVTPDGAVQTHHEWPRPILSEIPFGAEGAIAWGDGLSRYPETQPGYVMYRHERNGEVHIEELPVRPTTGVWWRDRVYWSCSPRRVPTWTGLASWAPGAGLMLDVPALPPLLGIHPAETGLVLEPGTQGANGLWERRPIRHGWTWEPGVGLSSVQLSAHGAASPATTNGTWTAVAYPMADVVQVRSSQGHEWSMTCYSPVRVAWIGASLLVSTMDRELLLFENLLNVLERSC